MLMQIFQRLAALMSLAVIGIAAYLFWSWNETREAFEAGLASEREDWRLWLGGALAALSFLGKTPVTWLLSRKGDDAGRLKRAPGRMVETPSGARLYVEEHGPAEAPALIFTHGWGLDAGVWWDARRQLGDRYRVIAYDLAGLGRSEPPVDKVLAMERFAEDLRTVLAETAPSQAILVGHSIGGMILQTFAAAYPQVMGSQVVGMVLENTTPVDPSKTTILGRALHAAQPVLRPVMRLDIALSPLVKLMNWQSYLSGWTHLAMRVGGFGARPTRAQLEQVSLAATRNAPAIQAKGNVAMMDWTGADLRALRVPTLVFIGERDIVTVPSAGETIAVEAPGAVPMRIARGGHLAPLDLAEAYNAAIERFADQTFTQGAAWADRATAADRLASTESQTASSAPARPQANGLGSHE